MPAPDPRRTYRELAHALAAGQLPESDLSSRAHALPPLTTDLFHAIEPEILALASHTPRAAWALASVVEHAGQGDDARLQALAAFAAARAANSWVQPEKVWQAAGRARRLFAQLEEDGWVAACDWQTFATPWAGNDFEKAARTLQQAETAMVAPEVAHWRLDCRISLAFALILRTAFEPALALLERCEQECRAGDDAIRLAQTLSSKAACLRRLWRFEEAIAAAEEALQRLDGLGWPLEQARAQFQLGNILHLQGAVYERAAELLQAALHTFAQAEVDLWTGQCHFSLARVYRETGRPLLAGETLQRARHIFRRYPIKGLLADTLQDSGILALRMGRHRRALAFFDEAEPLYQALDVPYLAALCNLYRGETYAEMDRFQLALHYMELAYHRLQELQVADRVAEAALRLGELWLWLDRPATALTYLQEATAFYEQTSHTSFLAELYSLLTAARVRHGDDLTQVVDAASSALQRLAPHGVQPYLALLQRFIGEAYLASGRPHEAHRELLAAVEKFELMAMDVEVAECCLPLGRCYLALEQPAAAADAWRKVLALSRDSLPALSWPAHDGLARLALAGGDVMGALDHDVQMLAAFGRLRRGFWQPSLAGAYLNRSGEALDRAVDLAARHDAPQLLQFVEENKAQTMARRLHRPPDSQFTPQQRQLAAEIRWLQRQISEARHAGAPAAGWLRLQNDLVAHVRRYETISARSERQSQAAAAEPPHDAFDEGAFRHAAAALGDGWLALDYTLTANALVCVLLAPDGRRTHTLPFSTAMQRALDVATGSAARRGAAGEELAALARWLFPPSLFDALAPGATLIISPHRRLHRLPWAALPVPHAGDGAPLVSRCAPLLAPSLHSLTLLARRPPPPAHRAGYVVAVSDFDGRRPPLPAVRREADMLQSVLGGRARLIVGPDATWDNLQEMRRSSAPDEQAFLHIASHAFFDPVTGRASGLALYDRDVWLDELWELAPLPPLVSLSACSGMQSYVHEGDEHISLSATCLQAGARHVAGSLWPLRDEDAPTVTTAFYRHYRDGAHPALALARAQREAIAAGAPWAAWAPCVCVGAP